MRPIVPFKYKRHEGCNYDVNRIISTIVYSGLNLTRG